MGTKTQRGSAERSTHPPPQKLSYHRPGRRNAREDWDWTQGQKDWLVTVSLNPTNVDPELTLEQPKRPCLIWEPVLSCDATSNWPCGQTNWPDMAHTLIWPWTDLGMKRIDLELALTLRMNSDVRLPNMANALKKRKHVTGAKYFSVRKNVNHVTRHCCHAPRVNVILCYIYASVCRKLNDVGSQNVHDIPA